MTALAELFNNAAEKNTFDETHRSKMENNILRYDEKVKQGVAQYSNLDLAKTRAAGIRHKTIEHLDKYLIEFESNFVRHGGRIIWAQDAGEASRAIIELLKKKNISSVVKSKSMVTEEIGLNEELKKENIVSVETDLGEFIQQLDGEAPYHIVTPAMHKTKEDVAELFHRKMNTPEGLSPSEITQWVRVYLKKKFREAGAGITGANFLAADTGAISITENEGNAMMSFSAPKIHIVITGIDKIIPSFKDLDLFNSLLASYGTGQQISSYNSIISGPKQQGETDGPEELYLVLLDNGRTNALEKVDQRRALGCIRCGACLNACPVYVSAGGHAYASAYPGPIGAALLPNIFPDHSYDHLSNASPLCGKCTEVCPVKIDVHNLLLLNRRDAAATGRATKTENVMWFFWKGAMMKRSKMDKGGAKLKNFMLRQFFRKSWGDRRELPQVAQKSFNQMWRERKGIR
ncbi:MAG: lactate utilization protein [Bacteroidetes bacterium]|nr:lactate utilization protein [Bacteroidota bacterium]